MILLLLACGGSDALPFGAAAEDCAACHVEEAAAWAASGHATSGESPVYAALRPRVEEAWGDVAAGACDGCHQPGWGGDAGIGCVSCHAAVGDHGARDGRVAVDLDAPLAGPLGGGGIATPAHRSTVRAYLGEAELCGACHEVTGPGLFVERTLSEHDEAGAEACVACHARAIEDGPLTVDTPVRERHDHRYVGVGPAWGVDPATAEAWTGASIALLASALELRVEGDDVVVTNVGAGHAVPTGVAFVRSVRVEVEQDGVVVATPIELGSEVRRGGEAVALVTDGDAVRSRALAPGESRRARLPAGSGTVALRARAVREEVEDALGITTQAPLLTVATVGFGGD